VEIVIIKYNAGNVASVQFALERLGIVAKVSDNATVINAADKVIFPGVGEASSAMASLRNSGLENTIKNLKQPVLGICLGMQLLCTHSEEGNTDGLGIFDTRVRKIANGDYKGELKIPHMGWNSIINLKGQLYRGVPEEAFVYYVHGYCADMCDQTNAVTDYIRPFSAGLEKNNFYGVQFHPEKSGVAGEMILRNFLDL
jgi:glutamine amidotransferase